MNILTISIEQQIKLLELCKVFFPEYKHITTGFVGEWEGIFSFCKDDLYVENKSEQDLIHWYHLCLTELPKQMAKHKLVPISYKAFAEGIINSKQHPVDCLYQMYKLCIK